MLMYFGSVIFYFVFDKLKNKLKNKHFNLKEIRFSFKFKTMLNVPVPASAAVGTVYSTYL